MCRDFKSLEKNNRFGDRIIIEKKFHLQTKKMIANVSRIIFKTHLYLTFTNDLNLSRWKIMTCSSIIMNFHTTQCAKNSNKSKKILSSHSGRKFLRFFFFFDFFPVKLTYFLRTLYVYCMYLSSEELFLTNSFHLRWLHTGCPFAV